MAIASVWPSVWRAAEGCETSLHVRRRVRRTTAVQREFWRSVGNGVRHRNAKERFVNLSRSRTQQDAAAVAAEKNDEPLHAEAERRTLQQLLFTFVVNTVVQWHEIVYSACGPAQRANDAYFCGLVRRCCGANLQLLLVPGDPAMQLWLSDVRRSLGDDGAFRALVLLLPQFVAEVADRVGADRLVAYSRWSLDVYRSTVQRSALLRARIAFGPFLERCCRENTPPPS
ncbi:Hypothetical protein UVM_LOCUS248 [uncultured virus]|nr:Hypothetical protein UVM_LOCUS248 [uncultured virus]